jgi:hypothetical protein
LLILDNASINCNLCIKSLEKFIDLVHEFDLEFITTGILISSETENEKTEKQKNIIRKQLKGFIIGNNITFPIIIDDHDVFNFKNKSGMFLIFIDRKNRILKKYTFPLKREKISEIFEN